MTTVADLCYMHSYYTKTYGDLYDDLDSDIDGEDFRKYVWAGIAPQLDDAEQDLQNSKTETPADDKTEDNKTKDNKTTPVVGGAGGGEKCQGTQKYCKIRNILAGECLETTGFKTEDEGNAFRKWVNEKYPDYAKKIQLDYPAKATGRYDNCYIRLAWKQYGTEYKPIETKPEREENQMDGKDLEAAPVSDAEE
jgi:hypothetical protein